MEKGYKVAYSNENVDYYPDWDASGLTTKKLREFAYKVYAEQVKCGLNEKGKKATVVSRSNLENMLIESMFSSIGYNLKKEKIPEYIKNRNLCALDSIRCEFWSGHAY